MPDIVNIGAAPNDGTGDDFRAAFEKINNNSRLKLAANLDLYVATTGNDTTGDGSSGAPWLTIQKAIDHVANTLDLAGFNVTILVADGTYAESVQLRSVVGEGSVNLRGNTTTPANVLISPASGDCFQRSMYTDGNRVPYDIRGFKVVAPSGRQGFWIRSPAYVLIREIDFGVCAHHVIADGPGARVFITGPYTVSGNADVHIWARYGALVYMEGTFTVTFSGSRAWAAFGWFVTGQSQINAEPATITYSGTITGQRFSVTQNSIIVGSAKAPGSTAGTTATSGVAA
jgi:hypothetical protein